MEKYKKAIRRALHSFNYCRRIDYIIGAKVADGEIQGIIRIATYDSEVSDEDFSKMQNLHQAMFNKILKM